MKEEDLQKLFKNFGKLEDKQLINKGGLGLGLTISKTICELLGGSISVDSKLDVGSRFTFKIKIELLNDDQLTNNSIVMERLD